MDDISIAENIWNRSYPLGIEGYEKSYCKDVFQVLDDDCSPDEAYKSLKFMMHQVSDEMYPVCFGGHDRIYRLSLQHITDEMMPENMFEGVMQLFSQINDDYRTDGDQKQFEKHIDMIYRNIPNLRDIRDINQRFLEYVFRLEGYADLSHNAYVMDENIAQFGRIRDIYDLQRAIRYIDLYENDDAFYEYYARTVSALNEITLVSHVMDCDPGSFYGSFESKKIEIKMYYRMAFKQAMEIDSRFEGVNDRYPYIKNPNRVRSYGLSDVLFSFF